MRILRSFILCFIVASLHPGSAFAGVPAALQSFTTWGDFSIIVNTFERIGLLMSDSAYQGLFAGFIVIAIVFGGIGVNIPNDGKIGLVGPNGAGKSTLLKIILDDESSDNGEVTFMRGTRVGYLPQESEPAAEETVLEIALSHGHETDGHKVARAKQILASLGFRQTDFDRLAREMSGGWVMRARLARLLVDEPDLLVDSS